MIRKLVLILATLHVMEACKTVPKTSVEEREYSETLFMLGEITMIELKMPEETWQKIIRKAADKKYYECDVTINGEHLEDVAIRTKGASSLDDVSLMKSNRYSFTLKLNKYIKRQNYYGLSKLLLNNNIWDATQMKDVIVYDMCRYIGLPAPLANYAKVKGGEASILRIIDALKSVKEGKDIDKHVDIESVMKYMALQTIVVNYDCMTPATWEAQKAQPQRLVNCDDINLQELGGI